MKFSEIMIYYDYNMSNIARALGISRQVVSRWHRNGKIPYKNQCEIEVLTKGALKASKDD